MGILAGATSLVELILKKYGDDVAGATEELVRLGGFPEPVARRIATGELPMDAESVAKRAQDQGYGETMLHGSSAGGYNKTHDIKEIDPEKAGDKWGQDREGFFLTNDPVEADYYATTDSMGRTVDGTVYPLKYKSDSPKVISSADDIDLASEQPVGYWDERHGELISEARANGNDSISLLDYGPYEDKSHKMTVVLNPNNIRSPNAAFDPEYTGSNIMGGLALPVTAGLLAAGQSEDADAGFVTRGGKTLLEAWHGSPHKFDRFSMDQIGTGEGAQAYGHGLYFADSEDVARGYRDRLSGDSASMYGGLDIKWGGQEVPEAYREAASYLNDPLVMGEAKTNDAAGLAGVLESIPGYEDSAKWLRDNSDKITATPSGNLYRTEIDVTPESLLDWDKPLSEQSEAVRGAIGDLAKQAESDAVSPSLLSKRVTGADGVSRYADLRQLDKIDGSSAHEILESIYGTSASEQLNNRGIKGIKYLDGDSRAVGDGTSNYVIFDDSLINIAERGNADPRLLAGTAAGSAGLLAAPMVKDSGMISAPRSEGLFNLTMGARDLERRLEGSPASLLFPSGLIDYLETVNRRTEDPNAMTRGMALLDFF